MKILLVEDQVLFRKGLKELLEGGGLGAVCHEVGSATEALSRVAMEAYDLLLSDLTLPDFDGLWLLRKLRQERPELPVLVVTMHERSRTVRAALDAGAVGYILKDARTEDLLEAVRSAASGRRYLQPRLKTEAGTSQIPNLGLADLELLQLARRGWNDDAIRERLSLSPASFRSRIKSLCRKLGGDNLAAAVVRALEEGVLVSDAHR